MENEIAIGFVDKLLAVDNIALILMVGVNLAQSWFIYRRYKDDLNRVDKERELQKAEIDKDIKLAQVLESLKSEINVMQKLDSIAARKE